VDEADEDGCGGGHEATDEVEAPWDRDTTEEEKEEEEESSEEAGEEEGRDEEDEDIEEIEEDKEAEETEEDAPTMLTQSGNEQSTRVCVVVSHEGPPSDGAGAEDTRHRRRR